MHEGGGHEHAKSVVRFRPHFRTNKYKNISGTELKDVLAHGFLHRALVREILSYRFVCRLQLTLEKSMNFLLLLSLIHI